jgi:transposase InsO family protein
VKKRRTRTTNSDHPFPRYPNLVKGETATCPDAIWVADITCVHLDHVPFARRAVCSLLDAFFRIAFSIASCPTIRSNSATRSEDGSVEVLRWSSNMLGARLKKASRHL